MFQSLSDVLPRADCGGNTKSLTKPAKCGAAKPLGQSRQTYVPNADPAQFRVPQSKLRCRQPKGSYIRSMHSWEQLANPECSSGVGQHCI
jgi:hypothetical protein